MKKGKLLTTICMLAMTIACLTFGVFALIKTTFTASGTITFNAYNLDILVHGEIIGAVDNGSLATEYKKATVSNHGDTTYTASTDGTLPAWTMGDMAFDELNDSKLIMIKFTITNYSKFAIEASATIANQSTLEQNMTIQNIPMAYCYDGANVGGNSGELILTFTLNDDATAFDKTALSINVNITPSQKTPTTVDLDYDDSDDSVVITSYNGSETSVIIPRTIGGKNVTSIGNQAFANCASLTTITIPSSVTSIGYGAFRECSKLTTLTIPRSVITIEDIVFQYCSSLTSITIPSSVTSIGEYAFGDCSSLTSIIIPESVTSMGEAAFDGCYSLTTITVESGNTVYDSRDNCNAIIETSSNTLIAGCKNTSIPSSVTSIGDSAFAYCSKLTTLTMPSSVTSIGDYVFYGCSSLTIITIPESVTSIGEYAFGDCSSLTSITIPSSVTSIGNDAFTGCTKLTKIDCRSSSLDATTITQAIGLTMNFTKDGETTATSTSKWLQGPGVYTKV